MSISAAGRAISRFFDLDDTLFTSLTTGDVATWNGSLWVNLTPATGGSGAAIGGTIGGAPTTGAILIVGASGVLAQAPTKLNFDATNNRLGVGIATPTAAVHAVSSAVGDITLQATGMASQTASVFSAKASTGYGLVVGSDGTPSSPGSGGSLSEQYGAASVAAAGASTAIGNGATCLASTGTNAIALGAGAQAKQVGSIGIGRLTIANNIASICIGHLSQASANYAMAFGKSSNVFGSNSVVFGATSAADAAAYINRMYLGAATDATPQPTSTYTTTAGTGTDIGGTDLIIAGGQATGMGSAVNPRGGAVRFQTPTRKFVTGTGSGGIRDHLVLAPDKSATAGGASPLFSVPLPVGAVASGTIYWTVTCLDGTDYQIRRGATDYLAYNRASGGYVGSATDVGTPTVLISGGGTLAVAIAPSYAANVLTLNLTPTSSLATPTTGYPVVSYRIDNSSRATITLL